MKTTLRKSRLPLTLILLAIVSASFANEPASKVPSDWNSGSAYLLLPGRWEIGLFGPLRYGYSESVEFSTHPLAFFMMPNLSVKWSQPAYRGFKITSRHSVYYPTFLLRTIAREGIGGIIAPEFHIPHLVSISNELLISTEFVKGHLITGKLAFNLGLKSAALDERTTIDLPLVFPRINIFYQGYGWRSGCDVQGKLVRRWRYSLDAEIFYYPGASEKLAFEHQCRLGWLKSPRFRLWFGYQLVYGEYPFGTQWHILAPLFDLQWSWFRL